MAAGGTARCPRGDACPQTRLQVLEPQGAGGSSSSEKTTGPEALKLSFSLRWDFPDALEKLVLFSAFKKKMLVCLKQVANGAG